MTEPDAPAPDDVWERAYRDFETPEQEVRKFLRRLKKFGVHHWHKDLRILEGFCGRGNGIVALEQLGFRNVVGFDYSAAQVAIYEGPIPRLRADATSLPLAAASFDAVIIHGGLHHLDLAGAFEKALSEIRRVLRPGARLVLVEPWMTLFLKLVHTAADTRIVRRFSRKFDAFAIMTEFEADTYWPWHKASREVLETIKRYFEPEVFRLRWGKLAFLGRRREEPLVAPTPDA